MKVSDESYLNIAVVPYKAVNNKKIDLVRLQSVFHRKNAFEDRLTQSSVPSTNLNLGRARCAPIENADSRFHQK